MKALILKVTTGKYGHTIPLYDNAVTFERVGLEQLEIPVVRLACLKRTDREGHPREAPDAICGTYLMTNLIRKP